MSHLHSCYSEHIALIASIVLFNYIVWYKYETNTHTGVFAPISWILEAYDCIL